MTFKVAVAQIDIALGEPDRNYQTVTQAVKDAAKAGADVVVFPEMWNTGYALNWHGWLIKMAGEPSRRFLAPLRKIRLPSWVDQWQPCVLAVNITIRPISMIKTGT